MSKIARIGDTHHGICNHGFDCCPHHVTGTIVGGSGNVSNHSGVARDGDKVVHNCPHCGTGYIVASVTDVDVNGKSIAVQGDKVIYPGGSGVIDSGSPDTNAK
jgi:uncharacterized Zn-binding protein involved in type VI secretion